MEKEKEEREGNERCHCHYSSFVSNLLVE